MQDIFGSIIKVVMKVIVLVFYMGFRLLELFISAITEYLKKQLDA